ncbi:MAG: HlyU family transcriptional regulator [Pseudomonadota bacterium]
MVAEGQQFCLSTTIEKEMDGETKTHALIRADTFAGLEAPPTVSVETAQQVIDAPGDGVFL